MVLRTRDLERLIQGLVGHLDSNRRVDDGMLRARAVALVGERGALVAPAILRQYLAQVERRLNVRGVRIADPPYVSIDWQERVVVIPTTCVGHRLERHGPAERRSRPLLTPTRRCPRVGTR